MPDLPIEPSADAATQPTGAPRPRPGDAPGGAGPPCPPGPVPRGSFIDRMTDRELEDYIEANLDRLSDEWDEGVDRHLDAWCDDDGD